MLLLLNVLCIKGFQIKILPSSRASQHLLFTSDSKESFLTDLIIYLVSNFYVSSIIWKFVCMWRGKGKVVRKLFLRSFKFSSIFYMLIKYKIINKLKVLSRREF